MSNLDFSPKDIATLRKMVSWFRVAEGGKPQRAVAQKPGDNVWSRIVKTPAGGIPAYVDPDPGSADCDLCQKNDDDELVVIDAGVSVIKVWNASLTETPGDIFVNVWRDPWGTWWVTATNGGDSHYLATSGIPEATKDEGSGAITWGSATCERFDVDPDTGIMTLTGETVTVYHSMPTAVEAGKVVNTQIEKGLPVVIVQPCDEYTTGQGFNKGFDPLGFS